MADWRSRRPTRKVYGAVRAVFGFDPSRKGQWKLTPGSAVGGLERIDDAVGGGGRRGEAVRFRSVPHGSADPGSVAVSRPPHADRAAVLIRYGEPVAARDPAW